MSMYPRLVESRGEAPAQYPEWDDDEIGYYKEKLMDREKLLAAETFSYSYANYADHLGNVRHEGVLHSSTSRSKHAPCAYVRHEGVPHSSKFWK